MTNEAEMRAALDGHYYQMRHGIDGVKIVDLVVGGMVEDGEVDDDAIPDFFPREHKGGKKCKLDWKEKDPIIFQMRRSGKLYREIGEFLGVSENTARWRFVLMCKEADMDADRVGPSYRKITPEIEAEIVALRNARHTLAFIGKKYGLSAASVYGIYTRWYRRTQEAA